MENENPNVAAAPNQSKIQGKVVKVERDAETNADVLRVKIKQSQDVEGMANFTQARVGEEIKIFVPPDEEKKFRKSEEVECLVSYQGDEAGGVFFLDEEAGQKS